MALKGIGHGGEGELADKQRAALNPKWYYGWSAECPGAPENFVPMVWGGGNVAKSIKTVKKEQPTTKADTLLGFNEPDLKKSSYKQQSNISVSKAISLWPALEATGMRLGSPSTIKPSAVWLDQFMTKAESKGLRVDFIPLHIYGWPNADDFLGKVAEAHEKYQLPIWVTEFAVADFKATTKRPFKYKSAEVRAFMTEAINGLNAMPFVERYAWKTRAAGDRVMGTSALFHTDGRLTPTGQLYATL